MQLDLKESDVLLTSSYAYNFHASEMPHFLDGYAFILLLVKWLIYEWPFKNKFSACL